MTREILALPMECWRWIPGFEGLYQVSTRGRVRSVDRWITYKDGSKRFIRGHVLKPVRNNCGYLRVWLSRNGKGRYVFIHRLVAETWLDNPENKPQINHLNEQKDMNDVFNLSYCTAKANVNWGTRNKRAADSQSKPVEAIDPKTGQVVFEFSSTQEAQRKGFSQRHVSACCLGNRKHHKGYMWRYKQE